MKKWYGRHETLHDVCFGESYGPVHPQLGGIMEGFWLSGHFFCSCLADGAVTVQKSSEPLRNIGPKNHAEA